MSADPMMPRTHTPIPGRNTYIPEWGAVHTDLDKPLLHDGKRTGFKVKDVLPERRWAVDPETGSTLPQHIFEPLYKRWVQLHCTDSGQIIPIAAVNKYFNAEFESCPRVDEFVLQTIDEDGRPVPVGWEARRARKPGDGPAKLYDASGENPRTAEETLRIYRAQRAMKKLQRIEGLRTVLPAEAYQAKVDAILEDEGISVDDLTAGLADSPEGFDRVPVSDEDIRRLEEMAAKEGGGEPSPEPEPDDRGAPLVAACGRECKTKAGLAAHERNCDACEGAKGDEEQ